MGAAKWCLFDVVGDVVDGAEDVAVGFGELLAAARHNAFGSAEEFVEADVSVARCGGALLERGDEIARKSRPMDVCANAHHRGGVEHGVDARLRVVAHDETAELQSGFQEPVGAVVPQAYLFIVVLEIGGGCSGTEVAPFADYGVAEETIVRLVAVARHDHIVEFATYLAVGSQRGSPVDFRTHVHLRMFAQGKRSADARTLHHRRVFAKVDGTVGGVEYRSFCRRSLFDKDGRRAVGERRRADDGAGCAQRLRGASGSNQTKVGCKGVGVAHKDVVELADGKHLSGKLLLGAGQRVGKKLAIAPEGNQLVAFVEGFSRVQRQDAFNEVGARAYVAGNVQAVGIDLLLIFYGQIVGCAIGELAVGEIFFPLFPDGQDADSDVGYRSGVGDGQQVGPHVVIVEKNYILHLI